MVDNIRGCMPGLAERRDGQWIEIDEEAGSMDLSFV
jgi:hypothetical protein